MLKILIAEDDLVSRKFLSKILSKYGECDLVVDGIEALDAYMMSVDEKKPYDLICLDIMMPKADGIKVLKAIRELELQNNMSQEACVKIMITTAIGETSSVQTAFEYGCNAYASKPIDISKFTDVMHRLGLINEMTL